jgi:hypothetical protein
MFGLPSPIARWKRAAPPPWFDEQMDALRRDLRQQKSRWNPIAGLWAWLRGR